MRISSITYRHAGRYTIMEQPQHSCINLRYTGRTIITHRSSYNI
uniref:Uncharacterized protein n=1 Tax=Arundo donax TaxID=35708 RepID=A0A0A9FS48_ARUDO